MPLFPLPVHPGHTILHVFPIRPHPKHGQRGEICRRLRSARPARFADQSDPDHHLRTFRQREWAREHERPPLHLPALGEFHLAYLPLGVRSVSGELSPGTIVTCRASARQPITGCRTRRTPRVRCAPWPAPPAPGSRPSPSPAPGRTPPRPAPPTQPPRRRCRPPPS